MEDNVKKYLDKVVGSIVRGTRIDYDNDKIHYPFLPSTLFSPYFHFYSLLPTLLTFNASSFPLSTFFTSFTKYCKNTYGLTDDEMEYVWNQYGKILLNKIENG